MKEHHQIKLKNAIGLKLQTVKIKRTATESIERNEVKDSIYQH
jgi:hypothetical protein